MKKPFFELNMKDILIHPFEIPKPDECVLPEDFPNCCEHHKFYLKALEIHFEMFPNCCARHKEFHNKFKFDKNILYKDLPIRILKTAEYTDSKILKAIENDDWLEDISDYLEYAIKSLGQPAIAFHIYLSLIEAFINDKKTKIPTDKKKAILQLLDAQENYTPVKEKSDLNLLYAIYQKWLNFFPFDLPFYAHLKPLHSNSLPIIKEILKPNRYLGLATFKVLTTSEFVDFLFKKTVSMLSLIDTVTMVKEGKIDNSEKTKLDFINQSHQHKQKMLLGSFHKGEKKYIKTIKEWLDNEKDFFQTIAPIVNQKRLPMVKFVTPKYFQIIDSATRHNKANSLFDKLVIKNYIKNECKANFINAFIGTKSKDKINWIGDLGDLKSFIKYCHSENLFSVNTDIWVVTSEVFTVNKINIASKRIKDTKVTKNDYNIKKLVKSIF